MAAAAPAIKPFQLYCVDKAGNTMDDKYPSYLLNPQPPLRDEEKVEFEKMFPNSLKEFEEFKRESRVDEKKMLTDYMDESGELIPLTKEWEYLVAEHVRIIIGPPKLSEERYSDNEDGDSTSSEDDSDSEEELLPKVYEESSDEFTYTSEEDEEPTKREKEAAERAAYNKLIHSMAASKPEFRSTPEDHLLYREALEETRRSAAAATARARRPIGRFGMEMGLHANRPSTSRYTHNLFRGQHALFLHSLMDRINPEELDAIIRRVSFPADPTTNEVRGIANWGILSEERVGQLRDYVEVALTREARKDFAAQASERQTAMRVIVQEHLAHLMAKNYNKRAITLATEMHKPDMVKKIEGRVCTNLAKLFVQYPTEVFVLDKTLRQSNEQTGVRVVCRDSVPVSCLTTDCFVDLDAAREKQQPPPARPASPVAHESSSNIYGNLVRKWDSQAGKAVVHVESHLEVFKTLGPDCKNNLDYAAIVYNHADCLRRCLPKYIGLENHVVYALQNTRQSMTEAEIKAGERLVAALQKFTTIMALPNIQLVIDELTRILEGRRSNGDEDNYDFDYDDDASGSYENDSDHDEI